MSKCTIERINNGFIFRELKEGGEEAGNTIVFEDGPITTGNVYNTTDFEEEIVPLQKLFYTMMDYFGVYNSKHEKKALDISIVNRTDFPIEDSLEELKELREENEKLKIENIMLTEQTKYQQYKMAENVPILNMTDDLKSEIVANICKEDGE